MVRVSCFSLLLMWGLRMCSLLLQILQFSSPLADEHSGAWGLGGPSRILTRLALLPLAGLGATHTPRLALTPAERLQGSSLPQCSWARAHGSRHTCSPRMEQMCHHEPPLTHRAVTHCLSWLSPCLQARARFWGCCPLCVGGGHPWDLPSKFPPLFLC